MTYRSSDYDLDGIKSKLLFAILLVVSVLASAQQEADRSNISALGANAQLERVEVRRRSPSDTELRRSQSVAKQIYGREELEKYGDIQLADVLKRLPGVNVVDGQLRMRGLGAAYTQILLNGEQVPPGFSLDQLNPRQVERLEVIKAPTADQSMQAIAGTLNIVLKEAPRVTQRDMRLGWIQANERPAINAGFTYGDRSPGGLGYVLPVSAYNWHWKNIFESERRGEDASGSQQHLQSSGFDHAFGRGFNVAPRFTWSLNDGQTLSVNGYFVKNRFNNEGENRTEVLAGSAPPSVFDTTRNLADVSAVRLNAYYSGQFLSDGRIELKTNINHSGTDFYTSVIGKTSEGINAVYRITEGRSRYRSTSIGSKYSRYLSDSQTIAIGGDFERWRQSDTRRTLQNGQELLPGLEGLPFSVALARTALYAQYEWDIGKQWSTYIGVRHERISINSDTEAFGNTNSVTTPVVHFNFKPGAVNRDVARMSFTRSYKAPTVQQLIARPTIYTEYPATGPNTQTAPDRIGSANLRPELATGLNVSWDHYLSQGGVISLGASHRRIRGPTRITLEQQNRVYWASGPRWVAFPINAGKASTQGLELEVKGRASELLGDLFNAVAGLSIRASLNLYRSSVSAVPGPNNRLEGQQPWQFTFGADYRMKSLPVNMGISGQVAPRFEIRQSSLQGQTTLPARSLDAYASVKISRQDELRLALNGLFRPETGTRTTISNGDYGVNVRRLAPWMSLSWDHKL